ncbi:MAG TPA: TIGR04086 family membrane protein [Symbiobacteriaceae bacterium]|jgi:putative membrane protein (TIGR04086 family)|nr:TIGR04086 family membrane protein [Symbiobacteriaceae bacterium]
MNSGTGFTPGLNMRAVGIGMIWGLVLMLGTSLLQTVFSAISPMSEGTLGLLALAYRGLAALVGGYVAARRASSWGWVHGAMAGTALVLSLFAVMGVGWALPTLADFLKVMGVGTLMGSLGGVVGINSGDR